MTTGESNINHPLVPMTASRTRWPSPNVTFNGASCLVDLLFVADTDGPPAPVNALGGTFLPFF